MNAAALTTRIRMASPSRRFGFVRRVSPGRIEASGPMATVGDICALSASAMVEDNAALAEVVAVEDERIVLVPFDQTTTVLPDACVTALASRSLAPVGDAFAGRAVDALGNPLDGDGVIQADAMAPIAGHVTPPLERSEPNTIVETGVRALDGLLAIGRGQRLGIFSASGVGKTTLVRQVSQQTECDHCVICLVGERGREVEQIWNSLANRADRKRFTVVAATSDLSAPLRARAVYQALCIAEYWRAQGEHVLVVIDSVTRFAMALRELGLAAGAPPTLRAYTPNVFAALPRLTERCGAIKGGGAITAIMTVLSETDEVDDPITEIMKSLLDGHIVLSRSLAEQGHFPPIDVLRSVSRQSDRLMSPAHATAARRALALLATYEEARLLIDSGIYKAGVNHKLDEAVREREGIVQVLRQRSDERATLTATFERLQRATARVAAHA